MKEPAEFAQEAEDRPTLPAGTCERVAGYGVMGLPFRSEHVLGLRRWTASSVGEGFTSIWLRGPEGRWTFYESARSEVACTRYFGAGVERVHVGPIELAWDGPRRLRIRTAAGTVDWTVELGPSAMTRVMNAVSSALPLAAWRSPFVLSAMGRVAGRALGVGKVKLTGWTSNGQHFDANPLRIWYPLAATLALTGLRFCHASALRWEDLDEGAGLLRVRRRQLRGRLGPVRR